jgi:type IV/VI secretion system ImpK/VasF family protein
MKSAELAAVHPFLETLLGLVARGARGLASADELSRLRADLRKQLVTLKAELGTHLTERETYLALFPLVVHADEIVQTTMIDVGRTSWASLQKDFFETDRGGEVFYQTLEDILEVTPVGPFVYQIYCFCLSLGFRGLHAEDPDRVEQYLRRLATKLAAKSTAPPPVEPTFEDVGRVPHMRSIAWYYAAAVGALLLTYLLFDVMAS